MADNEESKAESIIGSGKSKGDLGKPSGGGLLWLVVLVAVVGICAAGGFYLGSVLKSAQASSPGGSAAQPAALPPAAGGEDGGEYVYLDIKPITANLDEQRLARYVRATITLAIDPKNESEVSAQVKKRMPELENWVAIYLAGRTLDEVRGAQSLNRVRREICEAFNEQIWPQQTPRIHHVLLKEFAVQ